jgi:hypothetical protein
MPAEGQPMGKRLHDTSLHPEKTIAELQCQLAASNAERDEALAQLQAIAEVLEVINLSRGDLAPVWDAVLEKAARLCSADFGSISGKEDSGLRVTATNSTAPEYQCKKVAAIQFLHRLKVIATGVYNNDFRLVDLCREVDRRCRGHKNLAERRVGSK